MKVFGGVVEAITSVFGCQHSRVSRPFTIQQQSYMVCLECGHKLYYSASDMRRLSRREVRRLHSAERGVLRMAPASVDASDPTIAA